MSGTNGVRGHRRFGSEGEKGRERGPLRSELEGRIRCATKKATMQLEIIIREGKRRERARSYSI